MEEIETLQEAIEENVSERITDEASESVIERISETPLKSVGLMAAAASAAVSVDAAPELTIEAEADTTYAITYGWHYTVDICNSTDDSIIVNTTGDFEDGKYLTIQDGTAYNSFSRSGEASDTLYIKAKAAGDICIVLHSRA